MSTYSCIFQEEMVNITNKSNENTYCIVFTDFIQPWSYNLRHGDSFVHSQELQGQISSLQAKQISQLYRLIIILCVQHCTSSFHAPHSSVHLALLTENATLQVRQDS